jgi:hypothetical protein
VLGVIDFVYLVVPALVALASMRRRRHRGEEVTREIAVERFFFWYLIIAVGIAGLIAGLTQMFNGDETAELNDWVESPFVVELGMMNFTFGVLGLLCAKVKGTWWYAAGVGYALFLLLAAYYHLYDWLGNGNDSSGNTGLTVYADIGVAVVLLTLSALHARSAARSTEGAR